MRTKHFQTLKHTLLLQVAVLLYAGAAYAIPDNFANRQGLSGSSVQVTNNNQTATREVWEPSTTGYRTLWYSWTAPDTGVVTISLDGGNANLLKILGAWMGDSVDRLKPVINAASDYVPRLSFPVAKGTVYAISTGSYYSSDYGDIQVNLSLNTGSQINTLNIIGTATTTNDSFANRILTSTEFGSYIVYNGGASREALEPTPGYSTMWWTYRAPKTGRLTLYTQGSDSLLKQITVWNGTQVQNLNQLIPTVSDYTAGPTFPVVQGQDYQICVSSYYSGGGPVVLTFSLDANSDLNSFSLAGGAAVSNDNFVNAAVLPGASSAAVSYNTYAGKEALEPSDDGYNTVWFKWTAQAAGQTQVKTDGSASSVLKRVTVYTGTAINALTKVQQSSSDYLPTLSFNAVAGQLYYIVVGSYYSGASGPIVLSLFGQPGPSGSLKVTLSPAGAVSAGAQWQVDGGAWQNSGATATRLSVGTHTLFFNSLKGWTTPSSQTVTVTSGSTATGAAAYTAVVMSAVQVDLAPAGAVNAGAQWQVDSGPWQNSGATVPNLSVGSHSVAFKTIGGWIAAPNQTVAVSASGTCIATGTYVAAPGGIPDAFKDRRVLTGSLVRTTNNNQSATTETGEPASTGYRTLWYSWTAPDTGVVTISLDGGNANLLKILGAWMGESVDSLKPVVNKASDYVPWLSFPVAKGTVYAISTGSYYSSDYGDIQVNLSLNTGSQINTLNIIGTATTTNDSFANRILTSTESGSYIVYNGGSTREVLEPTPGYNTMWWTYRAPRTGRLKLSTQGSDSLLKQITVWNGTQVQNLNQLIPTVSDYTAGPTFPVVQGQDYQICVSSYYSGGGPVVLNFQLEANSDLNSFNLAGGAAVSNDNFVNAAVLPEASSGAVSYNTYAGKEALEPSDDGYNTVWFKWTAQAAGQTQIKTDGSDASVLKRVTVYTGTAINGLTVAAQSSSDYLPALSFNAVAGQLYYIVVGSYYSGASGPIVLSLFGQPGPSGSLKVTLSPAGAVSAGAQWQVDGGAWQNSGATVTKLSAGTHSLLFKALAGWTTPANQTVTITASSTTTATGTYSATGPTQVIVISSITGGTLSPNLVGKALQVGTQYTVTAKANPGYVFADWSGSIVSRNPKITFTAEADTVLQAIFVTNPFPSVAGAYSGLFYEESGVDMASSGLLSTKVTSAGAMTGKLQLAGRSYSLSGRFFADGTYSNSIARRGDTPLIVQLQLSLNGGDSLSGTLSSSGWVAALDANRLIYDGKALVVPGGSLNYTYSMSGTSQWTNYPGGCGYGLVTVSAAGAITVKGSLADGTKLTSSTFVSKDGQWPLYLSYCSGKAQVLGWMTSTNAEVFAGSFAWSKAAGVSKFYPAGFSYTTRASGSRYSRPESGLNVFGETSSGVTLTLVRGDLPEDISYQFTLDSNNHINGLAATNKLTLRMNPATGLFSGNAVEPASRKLISFNGSIQQNQTNGRGYFLGTSTSGRVMIAK